MLIFVYGEDSFRVSEKVRQLKEAFAQKFDSTGLNTAIFPSDDSNKLEASEVLQSACSFPFLGSKRMMIVRGLFSFLKKPDEKIWLDGFARMPESSIVIIWEAIDLETVQKKLWVRELSKKANVYSYPFHTLSGSSLLKWIFERVKSVGGVIDQIAVRELVRRVGDDLWQISHEIEKLTAFANGQLITQQMVQNIVQENFEEKIFELMDAISKKQKSRAVQLLQEERLAGSDDHYILTMLGRQIRILLGTRALLDENPRATKQEAISALKVHPYVAQKSLEQARIFSFDDLKFAHEFLFENDLKIKTGRISADLAMDLLTDRLMRS